MMTMSKKGYSLEHEIEVWICKLAEQDLILSPLDRSFRVPNSGAMANLKGDVRTNKIEWLPKDIIFECKHRKNASTSKASEKKRLKSLRVEKEWLDKNRDEAEKENKLSAICISFKHASKNRQHIIMPLDHFEEMLKMIKGKSQVEKKIFLV